MAKTKNELMSMPYSQVKDHCKQLNISHPKNATRGCMIHLILIADPPHVRMPTQESDRDSVDSLCDAIVNNENRNSVSSASDETSLSSLKDTPHQPQPQSQSQTQNVEPLPYPTRFGQFETYQPLSFPHSHYNQSKQPAQSQPLIQPHLVRNSLDMSLPQLLQQQSSSSAPNQMPQMDANGLQNLQRAMNQLFTTVAQQQPSHSQPLIHTANNNGNNFRSHQTLTHNTPFQTPHHRTKTSQSDEKDAADPVTVSSKSVCYHFNNPRGCRDGDACHFLHRTFVDVLREYHSVYYRSSDVNVKNIGIYLKNSLDGYVKIDDQSNPGYIKFGTYARTFCEVVTNFMLKEKSAGLTLYQKTQELGKNSSYPRFPRNEMNFIRLSTNKIIHGVAYNENARHRYIAKHDQRKILVDIYKITRWVNQQIYKQ